MVDKKTWECPTIVILETIDTLGFSDKAAKPRLHAPEKLKGSYSRKNPSHSDLTVTSRAVVMYCFHLFA